MDQPGITVVINGKAFSLRASDGDGIAAIPAVERQQLIDLLEAVKQQEERAREMARRAIHVASASAGGAAAPGYRPVKGERLGAGDVDALMARLVAEDSRSRKPGLTREGLFRWVLGAVVVIVLLVLIF
ncbi:MAG: hypothetical protein V2I26_13545 [Halieaceae bacterium]|jgi:hypothetical protein|nr:hypothetical protein [Halieaceae bacterium]